MQHAGGHWCGPPGPGKNSNYISVGPGSGTSSLGTNKKPDDIEQLAGAKFFEIYYVMVANIKGFLAARPLGLTS